MERKDRIPLVSPRGLGRADAASYIGVSVTTFNMLLDKKMMPAAKLIATKRVWDIVELDKAFSDLPSEGGDAYPDEGPNCDFI
ncbi:hypothetical protein [Flexibacterium corallicola]|uniref:hypothetical protein n=1 Tax=Flexibacterium corallicola TaxID=3037259 RepID=UPI00286EDD9A|nr:hypothetical protein [Pseudovibrio sp. M1P-2-3]